MKFSIVAASLFGALAAALPLVDDMEEILDHWSLSNIWGGGSPAYTSFFSITASPDQVVNATADGTGFYKTGGLPGCVGDFEYGLNSVTNSICWSIKIYRFQGRYQSAANTATHIHEGPVGKTGPPRIAFPNPRKTGKKFRLSEGCMTGPFTTGVMGPDGQDTGANFHVSQIEAAPRQFFTDTHSSLAVPGAVRGQFRRPRRNFNPSQKWTAGH